MGRSGHADRLRNGHLHRLRLRQREDARRDLFFSGLTVATRPVLADAESNMDAPSPVKCEENPGRFIFDIDDDLFQKSSAEAFLER